MAAPQARAIHGTASDAFRAHCVVLSLSLRGADAAEIGTAHEALATVLTLRSSLLPLQLGLRAAATDGNDGTVLEYLSCHVDPNAVDRL